MSSSEDTTARVLLLNKKMEANMAFTTKTQTTRRFSTNQSPRPCEILYRHTGEKDVEVYHRINVGRLQSHVAAVPTDVVEERRFWRLLLNDVWRQVIDGRAPPAHNVGMWLSLIRSQDRQVGLLPSDCRHTCNFYFPADLLLGNEPEPPEGRTYYMELVDRQDLVVLDWIKLEEHTVRMIRNEFTKWVLMKD